MYGGHAHVHSFHVPQQQQFYSQRDSYVPQPRQPMGRPSTYRYEYAQEVDAMDNDSDDSEADFYFPAEEEREFLRQEQQKRAARARQQVRALHLFPEHA